MMTTETVTTSVASTAEQLASHRLYKVDVEMLPSLNEKLAKLAKRAKKLGVNMPTYSKVERYTEWAIRVRTTTDDSVKSWTQTPPETGNAYTSSNHRYTGEAREVVVLRLEGVATVKLAGWSFLATLDHELGEDNTVVRMVPGAEGQLPTDYRHRGNVCDHCKRATPRKATYVVKHEDGRLCQVGSTCIRDFLGHDAGRALASVELAGLLEEVFSSAEDDFGMGGGMRQAHTFDLATYLAWVAKSIREDGWVSRKTAMAGNGSATADMALSTMLDFAKDKGK